MVNNRLKELTERMIADTQVETKDKIDLMREWVEKIMLACEIKMMDQDELKDVIDNKNYLQGQIALLSK